MAPRKPIPRVVESYGGVPCTYVRPDDCPIRPGEVCGQIHEQCTAHKKATAEENAHERGDPCGKAACRGLLVCPVHGGSSPGGRAKRERFANEERAAAAINKRLGRATSTPVTDPAGELARLAGELVAMKDATRALVADLEEATDDEDEDGLQLGGVVVLGSSGLDVHPLVKLHERAQERAAKWLAEMMKLGFVERHIQLEEAQADALQAALVAVLTDHGIDPGVVLPDLAARLHAIEAQATEAR